jgi:hypothetical protein
MEDDEPAIMASTEASLLLSIMAPSVSADTLDESEPVTLAVLDEQPGRTVRARPETRERTGMPILRSERFFGDMENGGRDGQKRRPIFKSALPEVKVFPYADFWKYVLEISTSPARRPGFL